MSYEKMLLTNAQTLCNKKAALWYIPFYASRSVSADNLRQSMKR
jgi:hypothetical protein